MTPEERAAAVAEEREACAVLAERMNREAHKQAPNGTLTWGEGIEERGFAGHNIAAAIRSRSNP